MHFRHFLLAVPVSANAGDGEVLPSVRGCHPWFYHESEQPHARYHTSVRTLRIFFSLFPLFPHLSVKDLKVEDSDLGLMSWWMWWSEAGFLWILKHLSRWFHEVESRISKPSLSYIRLCFRLCRYGFGCRSCCWFWQGRVWLSEIPVN